MSNNEYLVEYAKSGRAKCKLPKCDEIYGSKIDQGSLRIGKCHPSPFFDGMQTDWYHPQCLFKTFKNARKNTKLIEDPLEDLKGFEAIKESDKNIIRNLCENNNKSLFSRGLLTKTKSKPPSIKTTEDPKEDVKSEVVQNDQDMRHLTDFQKDRNQNESVTIKRYYLKGVSDKNMHVFHEIIGEGFLGRNSFNLDELMNNKSISKEQVRVEPVCGCDSTDNCTCEGDDCLLSICVMGKNPVQILKKGDPSMITLNKGETYRLCNGDQFNLVVGSGMFKLMTEVHKKNKRKLSDKLGPLSDLITDANKKQKKSNLNSKITVNNSQNNNNGDDDAMDVSLNLSDITPLHLINEGDSVNIDDKYTIKRYRGDMYHCSCTAWKMQSLPWPSRTCKHLKQYLGDEYEFRRVGGIAPTQRKKLINQKSIDNIDNDQKVEKKTPKAIPLLLAQKYDNTDPTGWWMSEKLDGVRAYWNGTSLISRYGNVFHAPDYFLEPFQQLQSYEFDGELFTARGKFDRTISIVKTQNMEKELSQRWNEVKYYIFDIPSLKELPFEERMIKLKEIFPKNKYNHIEVVEQTICQREQHLLDMLNSTENSNGEGLMLRKPKSLYISSRSSSLLKVKSYDDAEATVLAHTEGKGKYVGVTGALLVELDNKVKFEVGTGFTDSQRKDPPPIGSIITFRYQGLTRTGKPRFARFLRMKQLE
jgi:DNA ligase-1